MSEDTREGLDYLSYVFVVMGAIVLVPMTLACGLIALACWLVAGILWLVSRPKFIPADDNPSFAQWADTHYKNR